MRTLATPRKTAAFGDGFDTDSKVNRYYFDRRRKDRAYVRDEWLVEAWNHPFHVEIQPDGRKRHYLYISEHHKYLRVVFDGEMVHNAFFDTGFTRKRH